MVSGVGSKKRVLDGRSHWHQLANTIVCGIMTGSAVKGGDAASSQINMGNLVIFISTIFYTCVSMIWQCTGVRAMVELRLLVQRVDR